MRKNLLPGAALGFVLALMVTITNASAQEPEPSVGNETCLECHGDQGISMPLLNGDLLSLYIDPEIYAESVHGESGYACIQCHTGLGDYPHATYQAENRREVSLDLYTACQRCHSGEYERTLDSAHEQARETGVLDAAVCTDCHGAHNTKRLTDSQTGNLLADTRTWIPQTCARCHNSIFEKYLTSVHGTALIDEANTDVPTCIDCHGVHSIADPTTAAFRLKSPQLCAGCHSDESLMSAYDISTNVLETYVADFHGTTVTLFDKQSPDAESNKPVCFDCHGVHDIQRTDHPVRGLQLRENLLARCQTCHPDATTNFPASWLSHYEPSQENHPLVFIVDTFYKIFIPGVLGGMGIIVALDFSWRVRQTLRNRKGREFAEAPQADMPIDPEAIENPPESHDPNGFDHGELDGPDSSTD